MKKTITANINGTVFHIEEDAYEQLNAYLESIRRKFHGSPDTEEILSDIEGRISELFMERRGDVSQVVTHLDVDYVVKTMGSPEEFMGEDNADESYSSAQNNATKKEQATRKLYRDPDDRWLGGVLSGIAAYFNTKSSYMRLLFIISLFLGVPLIIYIIAWIIVPKAVSNAEKLQMRGEAVTVENIKRMFEDGIDAVEKGAKNFAEKAEGLGKDFRSGNPGNGVDRFFSFLGETIAYLFKALGKIIGFLFILFGGILLIALIVAFFGKGSIVWQGTDWLEYGHMQEAASLIFSSSAQGWFTIIAAALAAAIPAIWLVMAGTRLLGRKRISNWWALALAPLWVIALLFFGVNAAEIGSDFNKDRKRVEPIAIVQPESEVLHISARMDDHFEYTPSEESIADIEFKNGRVFFPWADLEIVQSEDSLFRLVAISSAHGRSSKKARTRAGHIEYGVEVSDDIIRLAPYFSIPREDRFRAQHLTYRLEVPIGSAVLIDEDVAPMIEDTRNLQGIDELDMGGKTWTMTEKGLSNKIGPEEVEYTDPNERGYPESDEDLEKETEEESLRESPVVELPKQEPIPFNMPTLVSLYVNQ